MPKTLLSVRNSLRNKLEDPSTGGYWTDTELNENINEAKDFLIEAINTINPSFFIKSIDITISALSEVGELPIDFYRLKNIKTKTPVSSNDQVWTPLDLATDDFNSLSVLDSDNSGRKAMYFDIYTKDDEDKDGDINRIKVVPSISTEYVITVDYVSTIPDLSDDGDTFGVINPWVTYVKHKAMQLCFEKGPSGPYSMYESKAAKYLDNILTNVGRRQIKKNKKVEDLF